MVELEESLMWKKLRLLTLKDTDSSILTYFETRAPLLQEIVLKGLLKKERNWAKELSVVARGKLELIDIRSLGVHRMEVIEEDSKRGVLVLGKGKDKVVTHFKE